MSSAGRRWSLRVEKEGAVIDEVVLKKAENVIGREESCEIVMAHTSISRRHAVVSVKEDEVYLKDLDSVYGTTIDGIKVSESTKLLPGSLIRLGHSTRSLHLVDAKKDTSSRAQRVQEIANLTKTMLQEPPAWSKADTGPKQDSSSESSSESDDDDEGPQEMRVVGHSMGLPICAEAELGGTVTGKSLTVLAWDHSGARLATGTAAGVIKLYDFGGMDSQMLPFREVSADEGSHAVVSLSFSPNGDRFLSCVTGPQPQIFDRDGKSLLRFNRGDMYIKDLVRTTGHTTAVTGGAWQPYQNSRCGTCGIDGSLRLWDLSGKTGLRNWLFSENVIKIRDASNRKAAATAMTFSPEGDSVCVSANDGSLQIWRLRGRSHTYSRPDALRRNAHTRQSNAAGSVISCLAFSPDGHILGSRADDGRLKLWDLRRGFSSNGLGGQEALLDVPIPSDRAQASTNLTFSPDGRYVLAGSDDGFLHCYDILQKRQVLSLPVKLQPTAKNTSSGVSFVLWHPRLQQIVSAHTDGTAKLLYDPEISTKGALLALGGGVKPQSKRKRTPEYAHAADLNAAAVNNDQPLRSSLTSSGYARNRKDSKKSRLPDPPLKQGQQGRTTGAKATLSQFWLDPYLPENIRNTDPREALLKYAHQPSTFRTDTTFYRDAQGKPVLDTETLEQAEQNYVDEQISILNRAPMVANGDEDAVPNDQAQSKSPPPPARKKNT